MSTQYSDLHVRLETDVKTRAEEILSDIGISPSGAINIFYRQIVNHDGLPFKVTRVKDLMPSEDKLTSEQICERLSNGISDIKDGKFRPADEVFKNILGD